MYSSSWGGTTNMLGVTPYRDMPVKLGNRLRKTRGMRSSVAGLARQKRTILARFDRPDTRNKHPVRWRAIGKMGS